MKLPNPPLDNRSYRILVAEDDPAIARMVEMQLKASGFSVEIARDGEQAWTMFEHNPQHLVLSDIQMPGLTGHELTVKIRAAGSGVPIILMTAAGSEDFEMQGFKSGADDYVPKPFNPKLLMARVVASLRRVYRYDVAATGAGATGAGASQSAAAPSNSVNDAAKHAASAIAALRPRGAGGAAIDPDKDVPEGWSECSSCGYLGPQFKFEATDVNGEQVFICPNCKSRSLSFSLG